MVNPMTFPQTTDAAVASQMTSLDCERESVQPLSQENRVLIVDDSLDSAQTLSDCLTREGCLCEMATNGDRALNVVRGHGCDVVICDVRIGIMNEFELLKQIKAIMPQLPVIVGTAINSTAAQDEAEKYGAYHYAEKPFEIRELLTLIARASADSRRFRKTTRPPGRVPEVSDIDGSPMTLKPVNLRHFD